MISATASANQMRTARMSTWAERTGGHGTCSLLRKVAHDVADDYDSASAGCDQSRSDTLHQSEARHDAQGDRLDVVRSVLLPEAHDGRLDVGVYWNAMARTGCSSIPLGAT